MLLADRDICQRSRLIVVPEISGARYGRGLVIVFYISAGAPRNVDKPSPAAASGRAEECTLTARRS
jgi:hypothetical protein